MIYYMTGTKSFANINEARAFQTLSPSIIREIDGAYVLTTLSRTPIQPGQAPFIINDDDETWCIDR